ncbi:2-hydroxyisoflavanone dehydratase-like protein [Drosera capensis]
MEPTDSSEVLHEFSPLFRVYKGGRVERFREISSIPAFPSGDPKTGVRSKDTVVALDTGASVRLFVPPIKNLNKKLPLLIYIHGGAFCIQSAFSSVFHKYVSSLASEANVIAVSVEYRLAPEHPIPTCYDDTWDVIRWVFSHAGTDDPRLNPAADPAQLLSLGCKKMLICLAENDHLKGRGVAYHEALKKSGWDGVVEVFETEEEGEGEGVVVLWNPVIWRCLAVRKERISGRDDRGVGGFSLWIECDRLNNEYKVG